MNSSVSEKIDFSATENLLCQIWIPNYVEVLGLVMGTTGSDN